MIIQRSSWMWKYLFWVERRANMPQQWEPSESLCPLVWKALIMIPFAWAVSLPFRTILWIVRKLHLAEGLESGWDALGRPLVENVVRKEKVQTVAHFIAVIYGKLCPTVFFDGNPNARSL